MSNLPITALTPEQALKRNFEGYTISEKKDGTLIYFKEGRLFSPRCERSERFKHILNILKEKNMPNCYGEMFIEGGNVFTISSKENWKKAKFMPIDIEDKSLSYAKRQILLQQFIKEIDSEFITPLKKFSDFQQGWDYVKKTNGEGLVLRNENNWFKVKALQEAKVEIKEHEPSKEKGTFVLINGNRVSGTSRDFVKKFHEIKAQGKIPIAEIEFPFLTENGAYFQGRLRRIYAKGEENE